MSREIGCYGVMYYIITIASFLGHKLQQVCGRAIAVALGVGVGLKKSLCVKEEKTTLFSVKNFQNLDEIGGGNPK